VALTNPNSPDTAEREKVDIIYFPTGGGKTEAYLATLVFHCFFDRLRGKAAGVTAWTRFPLRLLTLQQTQRVADVIGIAELVRREQRDPRLSGRNVDGFAVGYLVGEGGSPNEIVDPDKYRHADQATWSKANDPKGRQEWQRVIRCPSCRTSTVRVDFDSAEVRVIHRCTQPGCAFPSGEIPIYIVDNEIYRFLPCAIVGTIDKLAGLGNQRKLAQIFGQVDGRCTEHGYYKGKCCQKDCNDAKRLRRGVPQGLSGPTLFVQDELHLLKEGLGTFDGHYETFTQQLRRELGQAEPLKLIASSATIEAFARQVEHLYGRKRVQARVFPGFGPRLGQSFYARTLDHPQRLFVGLIPHNKTIFNTILELIEYYHREVQGLQLLPSGSTNPYGGVLTPGTPEWRGLLDCYATSLTYFLSNRELNSIRTDLAGDVNPNLQRDSLMPLEIAELTGSTGTDEVTRILERLEGNLAPNTSLDAVLATSMVSHGVDVDRFNAMIFYGMPRQNAEYIQASSRVGRAHVGIIFNCLHPARERDQSHYASFVKFHEFLGQLVEPVAINRWSKFSVNRTLPGLFMGVLLQLIANRSGENNPNRYYMLDFVKQKISDGSLRADTFIPLLEEAYRVQAASTTDEMAFRNEIRLRVQQFLDWILGAGSGRTFVSDVLIPKPMRSLRDVDSSGSQWAARAGHR
jgi:Helicase conserved C-terminal domain